MADRRLLIGLILFVLGALLFVGSLFLGGSTSGNLPPASSGAYLEIQPTTYGGGTATVSWSGGDANTTVTIYSCPSAGCPALVTTSQLTRVGSGGGSSGSFSVAVSSGTTYLVGQTGTPGDISVTAAGFGLTLLGILGLVLAVVGTIITVVPLGRGPPPSGDRRDASVAETPPSDDVPMN
jgi:hypothetical protein